MVANHPLDGGGPTFHHASLLPKETKMFRDGEFLNI